MDSVHRPLYSQLGLNPEAEPRLFSGQVSATESPGTVVSARAVIRSLEGRAVPAKAPCADGSISRESGAFVRVAYFARGSWNSLSQQKHGFTVRSCIYLGNVCSSDQLL